MNKAILMGRLTRDPEIRYSQGENASAVANFSLAVDRRFKRQGEQEADFINCVSFGKTAEFIEKYLHKGSKVVVCGRIQTGSYTNREGQKVYTTDVVVEEVDFAESKASQQENGQNQGQQPSGGFNPANANGPTGGFNNGGFNQGGFNSAPGPADGFMNIPDCISEELPFN